MHAKQTISTATAALTLILSATAMAEQGPAAQGAMGQESAEAAAVRERIYASGSQSEPLSASDDAEKKAKVDAATAADARYHANRTEANRVARDQAEAEAGATIRELNGPPPDPDMQR